MHGTDIRLKRNIAHRYAAFEQRTLHRGCQPFFGIGKLQSIDQSCSVSGANHIAADKYRDQQQQGDAETHRQSCAYR
ncbi:hypothetical protein ACFQAT_24925 [Undibacterium arcticum]|uniref:hypothetical protein n=1 Tax=Undibacterium arcticum TaxID=1762892 RepID=UPI0036138CCD